MTSKFSKKLVLKKRSFSRNTKFSNGTDGNIQSSFPDNHRY